MTKIIRKVKAFFTLDVFLFLLFFGIMNIFYIHVSKVNAETIDPKEVFKDKKFLEQKKEKKEPDSYEKKLKEILKQDYGTFVKELGENIKDPKFLAAISAGDTTLDKVTFDHNASYKVSQLIPTQSEIDVDKSLKFPLSEEKADTLVNYLTLKGEPFAPGNSPIIVAGGKYIIDGHHRWSQLYMINPEAKIKAINMNIEDPIVALKVVQLSIASVSKKVKASLVEGKNLLKMKKEDFDKWIKENIKQQAINAFGAAQLLGDSKDYNRDKAVSTIIEYIWKNAVKMQNENRPIENAPNRGLMPQTDSAPGWDKELEKGGINIR